MLGIPVAESFTFNGSGLMGERGSCEGGGGGKVCVCVCVCGGGGGGD